VGLDILNTTAENLVMECKKVIQDIESCIANDNKAMRSVVETDLVLLKGRIEMFTLARTPNFLMDDLINQHDYEDDPMDVSMLKKALLMTDDILARCHLLKNPDDPEKILHDMQIHISGMGCPTIYPAIESMNIEYAENMLTLAHMYLHDELCTSIRKMTDDKTAVQQVLEEVENYRNLLGITELEDGRWMMRLDVADRPNGIVAVYSGKI